MAKTWTRALVTGASGGIGEAFARRLAILGTDLVLVARDRDRLEALADDLDDYHGVSCEVLAVDLSDRRQLAVVEDRLAAAVDPVDLLVNNAGYGFSRPFLDIAVDDEDGEIQVNVVALVRLAHALASRVRDEYEPGGMDRPAGIVNVSSVLGFQPGVNQANYAATKAYVTSLSQALHEELRPHGITVTCLCPGLTRTGFHERAGSEPALPALFWQTPEEVAAAGLAGLDRGRAVVVSGVFNKALQVSARLAPLSVVRWGSAQAASVVSRSAESAAAVLGRSAGSAADLMSRSAGSAVTVIGRSAGSAAAVVSRSVRSDTTTTEVAEPATVDEPGKPTGSDKPGGPAGSGAGRGGRPAGPASRRAR